MLDRFPDRSFHHGEHRSYIISQVPLSNDDYYLVAIVRSFEQGQGHSQDVARDIIEDLDPQWLILVGIAGGVPAEEFTLGDVVAASRLIDFSVSAVHEGKPNEYASSGGPTHRKVLDCLMLIPALNDRLGSWNSEQSIGMAKPLVELLPNNFYGDEDWKKKVEHSLTRHFGTSASARPPLVTVGVTATSNTLLKDSQTLQQWRETARQVVNVEMELGGVYLAARRMQKEYPVLAIRGISDIVGFKRHGGWTAYACQSAAAFTYAFICTVLIPSRAGVTSQEFFLHKSNKVVFAGTNSYNSSR